MVFEVLILLLDYLFLQLTMVITNNSNTIILVNIIKMELHCYHVYTSMMNQTTPLNK